MQTEQWFLDRIGKKIYRDPTSCKCDSCKKNVAHGLVITDYNHADYLYAIQCDFAAAGTYMNYRDNQN